MTKEQKPLFEIFNNMWSLIKPYVSEEDAKVYKQIMTDTFNMLIKDRGEKYTDDWWKSTVEVVNYPEMYKKTKYVEFATDLAIAMCEYWEFDEKRHATYHDFLIYVGRAFINEWGRLRDGKETAQKTTG